MKENIVTTCTIIFFVLIDDDTKIQKILDFLNSNKNATEDEIYEQIDIISPPPQFVIK